MIRLLIVDDSALMRKVMGKIFADEEEFELRFARDGAEALAEIARDKPDVVTLDVQMPGMDGLTCLDRIMVEAPVPVVMVSSLTASGAEIALEALRRGAVDVAAKPKALSLGIEAMGAELKAKIRGAAGAKLRLSLRLRERVRHRIGAPETGQPPHSARAASARGRGLAKGGPPGLVLVGTSTGGPPALEALLTGLPGNFPWPVLVAQHMPSGFTGALARRLDQICALNVLEVAEPAALTPGFVYIGRGDADMVVVRHAEGLVAMAVAAQPEHLWHPSTERLVQSARLVMAPERLIGVLMTGMGNDGVAAMAELRAAGGRTIAEAEETAVVWGMPGELVRAGGAEFVLPLGEIAKRLRTLLV
jgi:two-component system chemotaxis response regulator CheB